MLQTYRADLGPEKQSGDERVVGDTRQDEQHRSEYSRGERVAGMEGAPAHPSMRSYCSAASASRTMPTSAAASMILRRFVSGALLRAHTGSTDRLETPEERSNLPIVPLILEPRLRLHRRIDNRLDNDAADEGQFMVGFTSSLRL
jgi:hypothetical protein